MENAVSFSGSPGEGIYSQTLISNNFYIVLSLENLPAEETIEIGRNVVAKTHEIISQTPSISPSELVEMQSKSIIGDNIASNILVAKIESQKLHLAGVGNVKAQLLRKEKLINLHQGGEGITSISGPILVDDLLILGTNTFFDEVDVAEFAKADTAPEQIKEIVLPRVESFKDNRRVAAVILKADLEILERKFEVSEAPGPLSPAPIAAPTGAPNLPGQPLASSSKTSLEAEPQPPPQKLFLLSAHRDGLLFLKNKARLVFSQRKTLYLAVVIFLILVSAIAFQLRSRGLENRAQTLRLAQEKASQAVASAGKLSGLNDAIAKDILTKAKSDVEDLAAKSFGTNWKGKESPETTQIKKIISSLETRINQSSRIFSVDKWSLFYDFSFLKADVNITSASLHDGGIVVLDGNSGGVYSLSTENKSGNILTGSSDLKSGQFLDFSPTEIFIFSRNGIYSKSNSPGGSVKKILQSSDKWGKIASFATFANNLYLLDPSKNQIWKYQGTDKGIASSIGSYFGEGVNPALQDGVSMAIDGFIHVLKSDGSVAKFSGGQPVDFNPSGIPEGKNIIAASKAIFTTDQVEHIYFLSNDNNKILSLNKDGSYGAFYEVSGDKVKEGTLLVDESVKKIFLLSGSKVFSIDTKQSSGN